VSCELNWIVSPQASAAYAAAVLLGGGQPADLSHSAALDQLVNNLRQQAGCHDTALIDLLNHVTPLSQGPVGARQVVETALRKLFASDYAASMVDQLSDALQELFENRHKCFRDVEQELKLRRSVFEQNWAARGPGLLSSIGRFTDDDLIASRATVFLVDPLLGGGGAAYLAYNAVAIEAVLANPHDDLPEIVRLAWLLAQLRMDAPIHGETVHGSRLPHVAALAILPPTLQAAEVVELCQFSPETVQRAIEVWNIAVADRKPTADTVYKWWEVYTRGRPRWSVALAALDKMLE